MGRGGRSGWGGRGTNAGSRGTNAGGRGGRGGRGTNAGSRGTNAGEAEAGLKHGWGQRMPSTA